MRQVTSRPLSVIIRQRRHRCKRDGVAGDIGAQDAIRKRPCHVVCQAKKIR